jgi:hypothetical protein
MKQQARGGLLLVLVALTASPSDAAGTLPELLSAEIGRNRAMLDALPSSPLVDGERPRVKGQLDDALALLKANRVNTAIETLSSAIPGVSALARAGTGWDDTGKGSGKGIDALAKEWEDVGRVIRLDRAKFPAKKPAGQSAFIRAQAEQSLGQIDEHYAVAVDYGRFSGVTSGAYYLGRAEGHLALALFLSRLTPTSSKGAAAVTSFAAPIARVENDIVTAYARPGSTAQHTNFILANSSLKLAKELDQRGSPGGALVTMLRSLFALSLATMPPAGPEMEKPLVAKADEFEKRLAASDRDESIGLAFVEKARIALERSHAGGEAGGRERLRAAALMEAVVPRYIEVTKGCEK